MRALIGRLGVWKGFAAVVLVAGVCGASARPAEAAGYYHGGYHHGGYHRGYVHHGYGGYRGFGGVYPRAYPRYGYGGLGYGGLGYGGYGGYGYGGYPVVGAYGAFRPVPVVPYVNPYPAATWGLGRVW